MIMDKFPTRYCKYGGNVYNNIRTNLPVPFVIPKRQAKERRTERHNCGLHPEKLNQEQGYIPGRYLKEDVSGGVTGSLYNELGNPCARKPQRLQGQTIGAGKTGSGKKE